MSEPLAIQPKKRVKIVPGEKTVKRDLMSLADVLVASGSRPLGELGDLTLHHHKDAPRPLVCEVVLLQSVYRKVVDHLAQDTTREHGGFLLGFECAIGDGKPAVVIVDAVAAKFTHGTPSQLTFTTDAWRELDEEISRRYGDGDKAPQRVGWYHSHPNIRIFLSRWDLDVCRTYERRQYPVALVVDPIKDAGGFFIGGAKGYDPYAPQGFYEAHDLSKESIVTWNNMSGTKAIVTSKPEPEGAPAHNERQDAKPMKIFHVTAKQRRAAWVRQIVWGLVVGLMAAAIVYLYDMQRRQQGQIAALQEKITQREPQPPDVEITIQPGEKNVAPSEQVQFRPEIQGISDHDLIWTIDPKNAGTISTTGVYKAPAKISAPTTVLVRASSGADPTKFGLAQIHLQPPPKPDLSVDVNPVKVQLAPARSQVFNAMVSGTAKEQKAGVKWTIAPRGLGKIDKNGKYIAPSTVSADATVTVSATSVADPGKSAQATVTLQKSPAAAGNDKTDKPSGSGGEADRDSKTVVTTTPLPVTATPPSVTPSPSAVPPTPVAALAVILPATVVRLLEVKGEKASFSEGESAHFTAALDGVPETDVTWSLSPEDGAGSISADGQYTAPAQIQSETQVAVVAKSKDDAKRGRKNIVLKPRAQAASTPIP